jgi:tetratricopeptide (TPR) repeat protein
LLAVRAVSAVPELAPFLEEVERRREGEANDAIEMLDAAAERYASTAANGPRAVMLAAAGLVLQDDGWLGASRERFRAAAAAAEASGEDEVLAVAALGLGGVWVHEHRSVVDRAQVLELQSRALASLDPSSSLAVRLRARLSAEEAYVRGELGELAGALVEVRAADEPVALADVLSLAHHCLLGPEHASERLALADDLLAVSARTGRRLDALLGLAWRTVDLFLRGDRYAGRSLRELRNRVEATPAGCISYLVAALDVMLAIRDGRLSEAEGLAERCSELGTQVGDADALGWYGAHLVTIRWYQGRTDEVLPLIVDLTSSPTMAASNDAFTAALAVTAAAAGRSEEARGALERLREGGLGSLRSSSTWLVTLLGVAEAADLLADVDAAREVYDLLVPFADWPVMASLAISCFGSAHRPLGLAAGLAGDLDLAVSHLEAAHAADLRIGNAPSAVLAARRLVDALRRRGRAGDMERAAELERGAAEQSRQMAMAPAPSAPAPIECVRRGREWRVQAGHRSVVVPHSVGMAYVAKLISQPGVEMAAARLAGGYETSYSGHQSVLDESARAAYQRRIAELRAEIEDADVDADLERSARARLELDAVIEELGRATGLHGRARSFDDDSERARTAVQKAIRRAIAAVTDADPLLGRQLERSIVTGVRCAYLPEVTGR